MFSQPDLIIAATAAYHALTVVSRDASGYEKARVPSENPWQTRLSKPERRGRIASHYEFAPKGQCLTSKFDSDNYAIR